MSYPKIKKDILEHLAFEHATPAKMLGKHTTRIYDAIAAMRVAREAGEGMDDAWVKLRKCMDQAAAIGEWTMLDDFITAWQKPGLVKYCMTIDAKKIFQGYWKSEPIRRRSSEVIDAIRDLQDADDAPNRAPTREEIRSKVGCSMTSLRSILTNLGLLKQIPIKIC